MPAPPSGAAAGSLPPAGFADTPLVLTEFSSGALTRFVRAHHPDPLGVRPAPSRFSDPELGATGHAPFAVLYLGTTFRVSFVETVLRDAGDGRLGALPLEETELAAWSCVGVATRRPLRLVDLTGTGPLRMGVPSDAVRASSHAPGRAWSGAFHAHPAAPDGLLYPSRLTGEPCLAVYDRARDALEARSVRPLLEMGNALADVLDELDIAIV